MSTARTVFATLFGVMVLALSVASAQYRTTQGIGPGGWEEAASVPKAEGNKSVSRGGWLVYVEATGLVYGTRGNETHLFYGYDPKSDGWTVSAPFPYAPEHKAPGLGSKACTDGVRYVYATKGNNTSGFFCYDVVVDSWTRLPDVPSDRRKLKDGVDIAYVVSHDTGYVYLLSGRQKRFHRYNTSSRLWETLSDRPLRRGSRWREGSWLVSDGGRTLYAHKAKSNQLWAYDIESDSWGRAKLAGMPFRGESRHVSKPEAGGSAVWHDGAIYALKGNNTLEFWKYDAEAGDWTELDAMPRRSSTGASKRVSDGGDVVSLGNGVFYALKGNRTSECWRYEEPGRSQTQGAGSNSIHPAAPGTRQHRQASAHHVHDGPRRAPPRTARAGGPAPNDHQASGHPPGRFEAHIHELRN